MKKPRILILIATTLPALGGLWWLNRQPPGGQPGREFHTSHDAVSLASLISMLDETKLAHAASTQSPGILTKASIERLLAKKASLSVEELRRLIAAGTQSTDPLDRARAILLKGDFDAAHKSIANVKVTHPGDLLATLQVKALAYEGQSLHEDSLAARRKIAGLTDKKKDPAAWATAQRLASQASAAADQRRAQEPPQPQASATDTPPASHSLPNTPQGQEETVAAQTSQAQAPAPQEREPSPQEIQILQSQATIAKDLAKQGKFPEAETAFRELLTTCERVLGPQHRDTLDTWSSLALALQKQNKHTEAEEILRAVITLRENASGPAHPDTLNSHRNLAAALALQGRTTEAEPLLRTVLDGQRLQLGPEHIQTIQSQEMLAMNLSKQGDQYHKAGDQTTAHAYWANALEHARTIQAASPRAFGENSPKTVQWQQMVSRLEANLNK